ncbi:MAG TPA: hypothetical protein VE010_07600, partial [Thermoanaerobaculia bacterium]|nr:hypothetical protein [Thermoanaerobaculia bacterium]
MTYRMICAAAVALALAGCGWGAGEVMVEENQPSGPPIPIVNPDYLVLRHLTASGGPGTQSAEIYSSTVHFRPGERIMDLRHFDPRLAEIQEGQEAGTYVLVIGTTAAGDQLFR